MPVSLLLLRVSAAWTLPGLGVLALAEGPAPHLTAYPLFTALAVEVAWPTGQRHPGTATVEEVTRAETPERALLLDLDPDVPAVLPGTEIWLVG